MRSNSNSSNRLSRLIPNASEVIPVPSDTKKAVRFVVISDSGSRVCQSNSGASWLYALRKRGSVVVRHSACIFSQHTSIKCYYPHIGFV